MILPSVHRHLLLSLSLSLAGLAFAGCPGCVEPPVADGGPDDRDGGPDDVDDGGTPPTPVDAGDPEIPYHVDPIRDPEPGHADNATRDSDCDGLSDEDEYTATYAGGLRTDPAEWDSDGDGIGDGMEAGNTRDIDAECLRTWIDADPTTTTNPTAADTDGDCRSDSAEDRNLNGRVDDGEADPNRLDSDADGISDRDEDDDCDGVVDPGETNAGAADTDGDGINDEIEIEITGTDPTNPDSDGDGILDGTEDLNQNGVVDPGETDPNVFDTDSDGDGIADATEDDLGYDADDPDMDDDGVCDGPNTVSGTCVGGEDLDLDGQLDPGESNPASADTDCDAVGDGEEIERGTDRRLRDSDGDLLPDGVELGKTAAVPGTCSGTIIAFDAQPSTTTNPTRLDTDGDGINDGIEDRDRDGQMGPANPTGVQETNAADPDTDDDGICDGPAAVATVCTAGEDLNRNGRLDGGETDPRVPNVDTDGDGLSDQQEATLGTNPAVRDTDGDGREDGVEVNTDRTNPLARDTDCDGLNDGAEATTGTNPNLRDTDLDGLTDGVERGQTCNVAGGQTDQACVTSGQCVPDANPGTTTNPLDSDQDNDDLLDGAEDSNHNGAVDPGELDPNSNDSNPTVQQACAQPIDPTRLSQIASDVFLAMSPAFTAGNSTAVQSGGVDVGLTAVDAANGVVAFAVRKTPEGADASAELAAIQARITGGALTVPIVQAFTTHDQFPAVRGTFDFAASDGLSARGVALVREVLNAPTATVSFPNAAAESGPFKLGLVVVRRSATVSIVVGVLTNLAQFNAAANGRDYRHEDVNGGTALAQVGDAIGAQCDVFASVPNQPVDFLWVLDNSGSMGDELNAIRTAASQMATRLQNSTLAWRIGVVTTEFHWRSTGPTFGGNGVGTCTYAGNPLANAPGDRFTQEGTRACACQFTTDVAVFQACVEAVIDDPDGPAGGEPPRLGGSGAEGGFGAIKSYLTSSALPVAANDASKVRSDARVVAIFISDAGDQSPQSNTQQTRMPYTPSNDLTASVTTWTTYFSGGSAADSWDPNRTDELPIIPAGILCPLLTNCAGETDATGPEAINEGANNGHSVAIGRYYQVIQALDGIIGAIADTDGTTLENLNDIGTTIGAILDGVAGAVAPYQLSNPPISSTIKVALEGPTNGTCALADVPRSRVNGFAYDAAANTISFFGTCRPSTAGADVAVSYRRWIDLTNDPEGGDIPCDGLCPPELCINDQCVCPSDCNVPGGLPPTQTCSAPPDCQAVCLADCGGCPGGKVCDTTDCTCECPADCNGPKPSENFICDPATCQWTCPANGCDPGTRPAGDNWVCGATCQWECPSDCGGGLQPAQDCNPTTCAAVCSPDCNATCGAYETCDASADGCGCECAMTANCPAGKVFDPVACDCVCDAAALGCPVSHDANLDDCRCDCGRDPQGAVDCNDCGGDPSLTCVPATCSCIGIGG